MILTVVLFLLFLFVFFLFFVMLSGLIGIVLTRVPFVPTNASDIKFIVEKLNISSRDIFYDLGSGDGKVVFLVEKLSGAKCVGFELTWWTYALSVLRSKLKNQNAKFKNQNFFKHNWAEADYIYAYLFPPLMGRVEKKFLADCKNGSIAIVRDFPFPNLKPIKQYGTAKGHSIFIYNKM